MSKGNIVSAGRVNLVNGILNFPITANMAPKAKVMVFYVRPDGEVVADGLSFNINGIFENEVHHSVTLYNVARRPKLYLVIL